MSDLVHASPGFGFLLSMFDDLLGSIPPDNRVPLFSTGGDTTAVCSSSTASPAASAALYQSVRSSAGTSCLVTSRFVQVFITVCSTKGCCFSSQPWTSARVRTGLTPAIPPPPLPAPIPRIMGFIGPPLMPKPPPPPPIIPP